MVEILYNTHRKQDAAEVLEKVVKLRPANVSYLLALADLYAEIDDVDSAKKYYYRVLEYEPSHIKAKNKLQTL
jgi:tetratricopeptide (TPR) repeat protein